MSSDTFRKSRGVVPLDAIPTALAFTCRDMPRNIPHHRHLNVLRTLVLLLTTYMRCHIYRVLLHETQLTMTEGMSEAAEVSSVIEVTQLISVSTTCFGQVTASIWCKLRQGAILADELFPRESCGLACHGGGYQSTEFSTSLLNDMHGPI